MNTNYLFSLLLGLILLTWVSNCEHLCGHNDLELNIQLSDENVNEDGKRRQLTESEYKPIRLTFDYSALEDLPQKNQDYIKKQVQIVGEYFSKSLKVKRIIGKNIFPKYTNNCQGRDVPKSDQDEGIENSDMHLYVRHFNDSSRGALASAGACIFDRYTTRPVFGMMQYNWAHINEDRLDDGYLFEDMIETTAHELVHALGFSGGLIQYFRDENGEEYKNPVIHEMIRGLNTTIIATPKVKAVAQKYFGCDTIPGMQLENSGGSGSLGSHWERVLLENEFMTASAITHDAVMTEFTFALLEDSGWYKPTYEYMEKIFWGKGQGCEFWGSCDSTKFREFWHEGTKDCNFMSTGGGVYNSPTDKFGEQCAMPQMYGNRYCVKGSNQDNSGNKYYVQYAGEQFGQNSRCFKSDVVQKGINFGDSDSELRCLNMQCSENGQKIHVFIKDEPYEIDRTTNKVQVTPRGKNDNIEGVINGPPNWNDFCNHYPVQCKNHCSKNGMCVQDRCHCLEGFGGEDCSIACADNNYVNKGVCLNKQECPDYTLFDAPTKHCVSCSDNEVFFHGKCIENCPSEYFQSGLTCEACIDNCSQCSNDKSCNTCETNYHKLEDAQGNFSCVNTCPEKYFLGENNTCQKCHETCQSCSSNDSCDTCVEGFEKRIQNAIAFCTLICIDGCDTCTVANSCQECFSERVVLVQDSIKSCPSSCPSQGYYESSNKECLACHETCNTCSGPDNCDTCIEGYEKRNQDVVATCTLICIDGCNICSVANSCQKCFSDRVVLIQDEIQSCPEECPEFNYYKSENNTCESCIENCQKCTDGKECNECEDGYYLNEGQCMKCSEKCKTCLNGEYCISCNENLHEFQASEVDIDCVQTCPQNYEVSGGKCVEEQDDTLLVEGEQSEENQTTNSQILKISLSIFCVIIFFILI